MRVSRLRPRRSEHSSSVPAQSIFTWQTPCNEFVQSVREMTFYVMFTFSLFILRALRRVSAVHRVQLFNVIQ